MNKDSKIYVAGHNGMVGSAIVRKLKDLGYTNIVTKSKKELDLPHGVVLNSSKPIEKSFLKNKYSVYIFLFPKFSIPVVPAGSRNTSSPLNILNYLKEIHNDSEVFIESSSIKNTESCLRSIKNKKVIIPDVIKDLLHTLQL